jgi:hypothetical protein
LGLCTEIIVGAGLVWWRLESRGWFSAAKDARARMAKQEALVA